MGNFRVTFMRIAGNRSLSKLSSRSFGRFDSVIGCGICGVEILSFCGYPPRLSANEPTLFNTIHSRLLMQPGRGRSPVTGLQFQLVDRRLERGGCGQVPWRERDPGNLKCPFHRST